MERSGLAWAALRYSGLAIVGAAVGAALGGAPKLFAFYLADAPARSQSESSAAARPEVAGRFEILAFEAPGCAYCANFRNDIARSYERSGRATTAPVRFIDVNASEVSRLKLSHAVTQLPTAVVMRDGEEVGRIGGYVGRENFYRILDTLIRN